MKRNYDTIAIIVAAGSSQRSLTSQMSVPKQYCHLNDKMVVQHSIDAFLRHDKINGVIVVINEHHSAFYSLIPKNNKILQYVCGGDRRQDSVFFGLLCAEEFDPVNVLIHDAARPFISENIISDVEQGLQNNYGVVPTIPITETLGFVQDSYVEKMLDRDSLHLMQTPQGFKFETILNLYKQEINNTEIFTDEVSLMRKYKYNVRAIAGSSKNIKITYPQDISDIFIA